MKKSIFDKRIPTTLALFLLVIGIGVTMLLVNQGVFIVTRASPEQTPQNVTVTNITPHSFTVSFTTLEKTVAAVSVVVNGEERLLFDNRDNDQKNAYYSHEITVSNLQPNSNYGYKILSNGASFPEGEDLFQALTFTEISGTPGETTMTGSVILPNGEPGSDTLLLITPEEGATASVVTSGHGTFTLPAKLLKNASGTSYLDTSKQVPLIIKVIRQNTESIIETVFTADGKIPPISLSQNYQFIAEVDEKFVATPSSLFEEPDPNISNTLSIISPRDNEVLVDNRPQLRGTAPAGSVVRILLDGKNAAQVRASPNGNWSFRPSVPLPPGDHTVSAVSGRTVSQEFSIFSSGSQIAQSATPSATLTPTSGITPTLTIPPTVVLSPTTIISPTTPPTSIPTPSGITVTSIPIGAPTGGALTPTIAPTTFVPTKIPLPPAGNESLSILLTGAAVLFIVTGSILFFLF